jgi:hypothetical protein
VAEIRDLFTGLVEFVGGCLEYEIVNWWRCIKYLRNHGLVKTSKIRNIELVEMSEIRYCELVEMSKIQN